MKKSLILATASILFAGTLAAQTTEFGVIFGGSKRVIEHVAPPPGETLLEEGFSLTNSAVDIYYALQVEPGTMFKLRVGRIEGPVSFSSRFGGDGAIVRQDREGELQHASGIIEYRFSEPFGSAGLFAGVGVYRQVADGFESSTDYGFPVGLAADFPLSPRYGVILDATYHFVRTDFNPRYFTLGAGLRIGF
jgi:hypothetical protein